MFVILLESRNISEGGARDTVGKTLVHTAVRLNLVLSFGIKEIRLLSPLDESMFMISSLMDHGPWYRLKGNES